MSQRETTYFTLLVLAGKEIFVDREIEPVVSGALRLYKERVMPDDALLLINATKEFLKDKDFDKLKLAYESIDIIASSSFKYLGASTTRKAQYTITTKRTRATRNKRQYL
jgi:hypothetical protein